jgi:hypothetical protein
MQFRSQQLRQGEGNRKWARIALGPGSRVAVLMALASIPSWSAVGSAIPFVAPILSLSTGVQAVVYAASCIGGMAGFIAAWKHEHSWSGIGSKALEYGSVGAMCIGFPLFLTAIIPGAAGAVI